MKTSVISSRVRRVRQAVQILAFVLYIYLLVAALQRRVAFPLADLFFRLDPLTALSAMLASRAWIPRLALASVTLGLTLLFGRVWCGWLCPLGTLLDWVRFRSAPGRARMLSSQWRMVKNIALLVIVAMALFGSLSLLIFDPLALFTRTMTAAILPALNHGVTAAEKALYHLRFMRPAIDWIEGLARGPILPVKQPVFAQNVSLALLFLGILALNSLAERFWCRYLCPLGALLGLLAKVSLFRPLIGSACNRCGHCVRACAVDAIDTRRGYDIVPSECTICLDCMSACPENEVGFDVPWVPAPGHVADPTRRQVLTAVAGGAISVALMRTGVLARQPHPLLIRPPGVTDEEEFLARCLRCSQCMKVCPTSGLQPVLSGAGLEGLWTPQLVSRLGHCDYGCNACGQICPSGAIPALDLERKRLAVLGVAVIDRNRCLPWAEETACIVCEEMCPVPDKAVELQATSGDAGGDPGNIIEGSDVQKPLVVADGCIGCGICEAQCPVEGVAAIRVYRQ